MRFNTEMFDRDIPRALNWLWSQIGPKLERRIKGFEHEQRRNPLLATYYRQTFPLEFSLVDAWRKYHSPVNAILPRGIEYDIAYGFAATTQRIYEALSPSAQKRLHGSLRDGATGAYGLRPLIYEMNMAAHLVNKGYDVECVDLESKGRVDFIASKNQIDFEMECKTTSPDKGRQVHRKEFNRLTYNLLSITAKLVDAGGCHVLRLTVPDRLQTNRHQLDEFRRLASSAVSNGTASAKIGRAEYKVFNVNHWPVLHEVSESIARDFLEKLFGIGNRHVAWHYRAGPGLGVGLIAAESEKPDTVLDAIADDAKDAADQCTGNRPALIMMQLTDITPDELKTLLQTRSGIHYVAHKVFKSEKRSHVDCIGFSLPASVGENVFATEIAGTATVLHNPSPKMPPCDDIRGLFRVQDVHHRRSDFP
jgi:hypothetical protein